MDSPVRGALSLHRDLDQQPSSRIVINSAGPRGEYHSRILVRLAGPPRRH
ncbi:MAG TPA: hypothetical protein VNC13_12505 [Propionibacteriaceae bacterium]|nr:hypothetical protein [Propionibacteriaceae bacterium]